MEEKENKNQSNALKQMSILSEKETAYHNLHSLWNQ